MTKSATAAASSRFSTRSQGFKLSESEITQKSWPSGAPALAAAANMADTPGTTVTSMLFQASRPVSMASNIALAMANTPGSPEETTGTFGHAREVGTIAHEVGCGGERLGGKRRDEFGCTGPDADNGKAAAHSGF